MATAQAQSFQFGVEVEVLLESCKRNHRMWEDLAEFLSKLLRNAGVGIRVGASKKYEEWTIVPERSVQDQENPWTYGVELVSPVYGADSISTLNEDLHRIFDAIDSAKGDLAFSTSPQCSTHVHISRTDPLSPGEVASLARAALYFERALDQLMPPWRSDPASHWARSNRASINPALAGLSLAQCLAKLDAAAEAAAAQAGGDTRPVIEVMNLVTRDSRLAVARGRTADFVRGKNYKWNLTGLLSAPRPDDMDVDVPGTIEFRQPPGCARAEDGVVWAVLAVAFVAGAVAVGGRLGMGEEEEGGGGRVLGEEGGSVEELWELFEQGRVVLGWEDLDVLKQLRSAGQTA
ncbi:80c3a84f-0908-4a1c-90ec-bb7be036d371 [Thermothielavioides terrestris]|uniref:80c3a84f-0908-4a1c-90ec-bb7be036d371 n=1 Tax=Thermothielavioides terrestris TaxID=2587410 RepID=A0A3S4CB45_9PEZI|nr:80c3a84f-0908-4a1c-90ec-bb7be036d371 [Thermothielavioides terrestris]